jgi:hypothetical protein
MEPKVVTIDESHVDDYGNLRFTDTNGGEHKIGVKRKHLFASVQQAVGCEIKLIYSNYKGKDYISEVEPSSAPRKEGATTQGIKSKEDKNKSFALSYAKDVVCALINVGLLKEKITDKTINMAEKFEEYLKS